MGFKLHMAHISFLKAVVDLWIWYLQPLRLWRCYSWRLYIEAAIENRFQSGFVVRLPHKHTHTEYPQPSTLLQSLDDSTLRDCKPWLPEERKGLSNWETAAWRLSKTVRSYKHEEETTFWVVCPFCSCSVLLLVDILPFSHNSSSSFLLLDLVSVLDLVQKVTNWKRIYKCRIETQNVKVGEERKTDLEKYCTKKFKCWMSTFKKKIKQSLP